MPESDPEPEASSEDPSPETLRRRPLRLLFAWLVRFAVWSLLVALVGAGLAVAVGLFVYFNRATIVNEVLATYVKPFDAEVGTIDFLPLGTVTVTNLVLEPKEVDTEMPLLAVPEITLTYRFDELRQTRRFRTATFESPAIRLPESTLRALAKESGNNGGKTSNPISLETFSFFSERFTVNDGTLLVDGLQAPAIRSGWSLEVESPAFDESGWLVNPVRWALRNFEVGPEGAWGRLEAVSGDLSFTRDLSAISTGELVIPDSEILITPEWFAETDGAERQSVPESGEDEAPSSREEASAPRNPAPFSSLTIESVSIGSTRIRVEGFHGDGGLPELPEISFETAVELDGIAMRDGRWDSATPLDLELTDISLGEGAAPLASCDVILVRAGSLGDPIHERRVDEIEFIGLDAALTPTSLEPFVDASEPDPDADSDDHMEDRSAPEPPNATESRPWTIGSLRIEGGHLLARDLYAGNEPLPRIETLVSGRLEDLVLGGTDGFSSDAMQELRLEQSRLWPPGAAPGETPPLLEWQRADLRIDWNHFQKTNHIDRFVARGPSIQFTDDSLGDWIRFDLPSPEDPRPVNRPVYRVRELLVTGGHLLADSQFADGAVPKILSQFQIETDESPDAGPFSYAATLTDFQLRNHAVTLDAVESPTSPPPPEEPTLEEEPLSPVREESVLRIDEIALKATAEQLQRDREIESLRFSGGRLTVGKGLESLIQQTRDASSDPPADPSETESETNPEGEPEEDETSTDQAAARAEEEADSPEADEPTPELPEWVVKRLEIEGSEVRFETLIPQVEGLEFEVDTTLTDIPLSPDGLLAQDKLQKIELSGIEIKDPYDSFITVAELPTIFVGFSLAGLAKQEVERIDLINPSLHVGQGLFWWIEYQRNFRKQNEGASVGIAGADTVSESPDWTIKLLEATAGKIVIAPTGVPLGVVPFPFNASTTMEGGELELTLTIPQEEHVYHFPDYNVTLHGLSGDVLFNVPVKQENNNLVQKFFLDRLIWKQYEATDLYLSVTFDEEGIYGDLGGYAYDGYVNAGFNFYLDRPGRWDAWIAGTGLSTGPITQVLAPENFRMEGPISLELVSEGFKKKLSETTAEFQTTAPGWFDVTKLDAIFDHIPEDWTGWQKSLTELGLIALKRFDYDKGAGSLYLRGRDGLFSLRFTGPTGIRVLDLHLHDERNTTAGVTPGTESRREDSASASADSSE